MTDARARRIRTYASIAIWTGVIASVVLVFFSGVALFSTDDAGEERGELLRRTGVISGLVLVLGGLLTRAQVPKP